MSHDSSEADWKLFRKMREAALEQFCERALNEVGGLISASEKSCHERYLDVYRRLADRDKELARAFDGPRRSRMVSQLTQLFLLGLIGHEDLAGFSDNTRQTVVSIVEDYRLARTRR